MIMVRLNRNNASGLATSALLGTLNDRPRTVQHALDLMTESELCQLEEASRELADRARTEYRTRAQA